MLTGQASLKRNGVQDFVTIRATAHCNHYDRVFFVHGMVFYLYSRSDLCCLE